jgi:hypothetical protein
MTPCSRVALYRRGVVLHEISEEQRVPIGW